MHKLVRAWRQDRLETDRQRQLGSLGLELMADASAQDKLDPSRQLRSVPLVMVSFGEYPLLHEPLDELTMGRFAMIDGMEGLLRTYVLLRGTTE